MKSKIASSLIAASLVLSAGAASAADGKTLFDTDCAKCHGADGKGATKMGIKSGAKDLTDAKVQAAMTDDKIAKSIKEGITVGDKTKMKAFPDLSADDVKALVGYVRSLKK
jgi:mono/diheme cytochrome c family protein